MSTQTLAGGLFAFAALAFAAFAAFAFGPPRRGGRTPLSVHRGRPGVRALGQPLRRQ
jgi:hypothetical protein